MRRLHTFGFVAPAVVGLCSMCAVAADLPSVTRAPETSAAISAFAAAHERVKDRLPAADRAVLDEMSARVRRALPRSAHLPEDARRILANAMRGLTGTEIEVLANYTTGEASQSSLLQATQQMQETQMSFNLQYLQLQNQMQNENRELTMVSNIMKTKLDTMKNSIANIR